MTKMMMKLTHVEGDIDDDDNDDDANDDDDNDDDLDMIKMMMKLTLI